MKRRVLIRPLVTEKMTKQMESNHYAFVVEKTANKIEIEKAIQTRYPNIKIKEVRTMQVRGKRRRQFTRRGLAEGSTTAYKKAIVTLAAGSPEIDFFESV